MKALQVSPAEGRSCQVASDKMGSLHSLVKHQEGHHKRILENEVGIVWDRACGWAMTVVQRCLMYCLEFSSS